jgi:hypothetical protein
MATENRIYVVTNGGATHLVQAASQAQAIRHIAGKTFDVRIAKTLDVAQLMSKGVLLEVATSIPEQGLIDAPQD